MITEPDQNVSAEAAEGEYILSLGGLFRVLWKRLWVIVLVTVVFVGAAVGIGMLQTPQYEASIRILVGQERGITQTPETAQGLEQLTRTMAEAVGSYPVAETVIEQEDLRVSPEDFLENLNVEQVPNTQFVQVDYMDPSPERAQEIANAVGDVFSEQISGISSSANAITATVWERAVAPEDPVSPNFGLYVLLALVLGTTLGVALAFLLEYLDDSWRSPEEAEHITGTPVLAAIPEFEVYGSKRKEKVSGGSP